VYKSACVRLCGGLGNQLFQFAFGCARATAGVGLRFDVINGFLHDPYRRTYSLKEFRCEVQTAHGADIPFGVAWRPPFHIAAKAFWKVCPKPFRRVHYERFPFAYESEALNPSSPAHYYWGYWQNPAYVEPIADLLRDKLQLKTEANEFVRFREEIAGRQSLSIHVRRYRDLDKRGKVMAASLENHGACDVSYYQQAVRAIPDYVHQRAYIFSDDVEWAKQNLRLPIQTSYVADWGSFTAAEELMLMAACQNHVISNSSFSWWGAWLGGGADKTVVAPQAWNKKLGGNQSTVCPASWLRL
jgi:hypothetical protein